MQERGHLEDLELALPPLHIFLSLVTLMPQCGLSYFERVIVMILQLTVLVYFVVMCLNVILTF